MTENVKVTDFVNGPFVIIVSIPGDEDFGRMVVGPPHGFSDKDQALRYIEDNFATRKEPYLGCHFEVTVLRSLASFIKFCSWED